MKNRHVCWTLKTNTGRPMEWVYLLPLLGGGTWWQLPRAVDEFDFLIGEWSRLISKTSTADRQGYISFWRHFPCVSPASNRIRSSVTLDQIKNCWWQKTNWTYTQNFDCTLIGNHGRLLWWRHCGLAGRFYPLFNVSKKNCAVLCVVVHSMLSTAALKHQKISWEHRRS